MRIEPTIDSATVSNIAATTVRSAARQAYDDHLAELQSASTDLYNIIVASESAATLEAYKTLHDTVIKRKAKGISIFLHDLTQYSDIRANLVKHASARILVAYDALVVRNAENVEMLKRLPQTDLDDYSQPTLLDSIVGVILIGILCTTGWGLYKFFVWWASL